MNEPILSLFPCFGLLDRAFEQEGFAVFKGPDRIFGGDIHDFHVEPGYFRGVIGGPPCQWISSGRHPGDKRHAPNLIPEFVRVVEEARGDREDFFVAMENVPRVLSLTEATGGPPDHWHREVIKDWDCGGLTHRKRAFWTWPFSIPKPPPRPGTPSLSVMATTYKRGAALHPINVAKSRLGGDLPLEEYARLQGAEDVLAGMLELPINRNAAIYVLGEGVPRAMGSYVAAFARDYIDGVR